MKKMSNVVARRNRGWILSAAAGALAVSSLVFAEPTLEKSPSRLSSNENAFGFTPKAKEAMLKYIDSGNYYNHNEVSELVDLLAEKEGVPKDHILTTAGSGPLLMMTALAYAEPGANVVTTEMGYTQLIRKFEERGGEVKYAALSADMGYDFKAMAAEIDENTKIVYICNPNNPTGVLADSTELKRFVLSVPRDVLVFVDEAYLELSETNFALATCGPLVKTRKNLIVTRTFSKGYALAGYRIGYAVASPTALAAIKPFHMGGPSFLAAIAACEAVKDREHLAANIKNYQTVRKYVCSEFDRLGIEYAKPEGAFIYFKSGLDENELREAMERNGILISGSRSSGVPSDRYRTWARVSIGTKEQMDDFLNSLAVLVRKT